MSLFKHAMVSGINDALVDRGVVAWPNEEVGFEVCSKVAAEISGPEMLPEGGLAGGSALLIGRRLKEASDNLAAYGYRPDPASQWRTKQASQMEFTDRAAILAEACMGKAAADASLTNVGTNTAESAVHTDQHAALDQRNRATNKYRVGVGRTAFPNGGVVGQQMVYPGGPSQAGHNSLTSLDKQAGMSDRARAMLIGGGIGAAGGGIAGGMSDEEHSARNALLGAGLGGAMGAGAGYGVNELLAHRAAAAAPAAAMGNPDMKAESNSRADAYNDYNAKLKQQNIDRQLGSPEGQKFRAAEEAGAFKDHAENAALRAPKDPAAMARREELEAQLREINALVASGQGSAATAFKLKNIKEHLAKMGSFKWASEDMSAADLGGADPEEAEKTMMFLQAMKNKGYDPGGEAQVAAAGLGQAGEPGLEVMAHIIENVKTASEADATFSQILRHQSQTGKLASAQLVNVVEYLMQKQAFSITDAGHALDAKRYGRAGDFYHETNKDVLDYTDKEPLLSHLNGEDQNRLLTKLLGQHMDYSAREHESGHNAYNPFGGLLTPRDKEKGRKKESAMSDRARAMLIGGGIGAAGGGIAGGMSDEEHSARNALLGAGLGGAMGAGAGYGVNELLAHRAAAAAPAAAMGNPDMKAESNSRADAYNDYNAKLKQQNIDRQLGSPEGQKFRAAEEAGAFKDHAENAALRAPKDPAAMARREELEAQLREINALVASGQGSAATAFKLKNIKEHLAKMGSWNQMNKKTSSLLSYLKAAADGSLTDVGPNTEQSAAEHDQFAALDLKNRAANAYLRGVGNTGLSGGKQVFDISKVPGGEAVSNSLTEGTKSAEVAYVNSFRKIASEMGPHLPATMGRDEKVAHLQTMLGLPPNERVGYLKALRAG
jgi:hypothetical protein